MTRITHHLSDALLDSYVTGSLAHPFAVVVAAHLSLCDACRARAEAAEMLGGSLLERIAPQALTAGAQARLLAALDHAAPPPQPAEACGIFPGPVIQALGGLPPRWRMLGGGIRQQILSADPQGALRLLYIPPGRAVPAHSHGGLELTLVLQGRFADSEGDFGRGDVEIAHDAIDHQPVAGPEAPCICLAATDAPLRFRALIPRLLQPLFRI